MAHRDGTRELLNAELRKRLRCQLGGDPNPSAGIVDPRSVKTTGVGGRERGFDPAEKVEGRKRRLLVDTEGLVPEARAHSARVPDQDGIGLLLERARGRFARLAHPWVDAGHRGRGKRWAEEVLGLSVEVVRKPPKPVPEEVAEAWARERAKAGGKEVDRQELMPPKGFRVLPRGWVVGGTFAWTGHNGRMAKDYERLCATGGALVHAAMTRLTVRRLARA